MSNRHLSMDLRKTNYVRHKTAGLLAQTWALAKGQVPSMNDIVSNSHLVQCEGMARDPLSIGVLLCLPCLAVVSAATGTAVGVGLAATWSMSLDWWLICLLIGATVGFVVSLPVCALGIMMSRLMSRKEWTIYVVLFQGSVGLLSVIMSFCYISLLAG